MPVSRPPLLFYVLFPVHLKKIGALSDAVPSKTRSVFHGLNINLDLEKLISRVDLKHGRKLRAVTVTI